MPTFVQALVPEPGEPLSAKYLGSLGEAFNSRILSGVGDCLWRICYYLHTGLFRQLRRPDASGNLFPPDAEFWNIYQHVDPNQSQFPETGPDDPEGTSTANMLGAFVYGNEQLGIGSEYERLISIPVNFPDDEPLTATRIWVLGQAQRGVFDPNTGQTYWPAGDVAKAYAWVRQSMLSPHGNAYGGWLPAPFLQYGCDEPDQLSPNPEIKFTNLQTGELKTYASNCPTDPSAVSVSYSPFAYYIFHASGAIEILPKADWIEGPYTVNATLSKTQANALGRVLNTYASEFRGTPFQGGGTRTNEHGFDLEKFLTSQYVIAPNIGLVDGEQIVANYPSWSNNQETDLPAGTLLPFVGSGSYHTWNEQTVCTGFLIKSALLTASCQIQILDETEILFSRELPVGEHDELFFFPTAKHLTRCHVKLASRMLCNPGGGIFVEATELLALKPQVHDYYFVTRLSGFRRDLERIDGRGIDMDQAKKIGESLFANGCVLPVIDPGDGTSPVGIEPTLNQNAVFDAARRLSHCARIIPRWNLIGYAVEAGNSVLWFTRGAYGSPEERDMWRGIAPSYPPVESGTIRWGIEYKVESGNIRYADKEYGQGDKFVGVEGDPHYIGSGVVRETNGILEIAPPDGFTNRWALTLTLKPYRDIPASIFKSEAFADINTPFWARYHFDAPEVVASQNLMRHECFAGSPNPEISMALVPEAPSGFTYAAPRDTMFSNVNRLNCAEEDTDCIAKKLAFYKSCRIYEPPLEIKSTEHLQEGIEQVVKVTLKGRLHHDDEAPSSIARDVSTWAGWYNLAPEDDGYEQSRTHENGIRDYLVRMATGKNAPIRIGDHGLNSGIEGALDSPHGSCYPTFLMLRLVPTPHLDANDTSETSDSPASHDAVRIAELYLRGMSEGFVDGITSAEQVCKYGTISVYDYNFENLMFQADANRWVALLPEAERPDNPYGFGPLPNTPFRAHTFAAIAKAVNLLTDARIELPLQLLSRSNQGIATEAFAGNDVCGNPVVCNGFGSSHGVYSYDRASDPGIGDVIGDWGEFGSGQGGNWGWVFHGGDTTTEACVGSAFKVDVTKTVLELKWELVDPDAAAALPGNLHSLLETDAVAVVSRVDSVGSVTLEYRDEPQGSNPVHAVGLCSLTGKYLWVIPATVEETTCETIHRQMIPKEPGSGPTAHMQTGPSGGPPGTEMGAAPSSSVTIDVLTDNTGIVRIPTAPYVGGT